MNGNIPPQPASGAQPPLLPAEPLVTVCIPAHNASRFIGEALESVLAQTYRRLEIIVVDDASTDETGAIVAKVTDPRLRYVRNERNLGGYQTMNLAVTLATGDPVAIYHADDVYGSSIVERQVALLKRQPAAGAVFSQNHMIREDGSLIGTNRLPSRLAGRELLNCRDVVEHFVRHKNTLLCCPTFMARRAVLSEVGPFDAERYHVAADLDMWIRIARRWPIAMIDEPLMSYRHTAGQWSQQYRRLRTSPELHFEIVDRYLEEDGWRSSLSADALREHQAHRADDETFRASNALILGDLALARRLLRSSRYPLLSLLRFRRRKARVLLLRTVVRCALTLGLAARLAPVLRRTEYPLS